EARRAPETPRRVADVVHEVREPVDAPRVADLLLALIEAAHGEQRAAPRLLRGQARCDALLDLVLEVEAELLVHLVLDAAAMEDRLQPEGRRVPPVLGAHESLLSLGERDDLRDRGRQPLPVRGLRIELAAAEARERVELRLPVVLRLLPLCA